MRAKCVWWFDPGSFDEDSIEGRIFRETMGAIAMIDEHGTVPGSFQISSGLQDEGPIDIDGVNIRCPDEFGENGGRLADAGSNHENAIVGSG